MSEFSMYSYKCFPVILQVTGIFWWRKDLSGKKEWFGESFKNIESTLYTERLPLTLYVTELNIDKVCFFLTLVL